MAGNDLVLKQWGEYPTAHRFIDLEGQLAYTSEIVARDPNAIVRLSRDQAWYKRHPGLLGPDNAFLYLGPENSTGIVAYGGSTTRVAMIHFLRPGKTPEWKHWWCQRGGTEYKWRLDSTHHMECFYKSTRLAIYELTGPSKEHYATLTVTPAGLPLLTEIITSLMVNVMARDFSW